MRHKIILLMLVTILISAVAVAAANIKVYNKTGMLLGLRILEQEDSRKDSYTLIKPNGTYSIGNKKGGVSVSAQLITSSYEINCCEWFSVPEGKSLMVTSYNNNLSCRCELR